MAVLCFLARGDALGAQPTAQSIHILAYNVLYEAKDDAASLAVLEDTSADVVCLREMTPRFARAFVERLGKEYPHRAFHPREGTWGAGLASRYPLRAVDLFPEEPHRIPALEATVVVGEKGLRVACLHLFPPLGKHRAKDGMLETMAKNRKLREAQAQWLMRHHAHAGMPMVLLGDFNEGPEDDAVRTFESAGFVRACSTVPANGCSGTWPGPAVTGLARLFSAAVLEIDHVMGRGVTFVDARTLRGGGSDHLPVTARFTIP